MGNNIGSGSVEGHHARGDEGGSRGGQALATAEALGSRPRRFRDTSGAVFYEAVPVAAPGFGSLLVSSGTMVIGSFNENGDETRSMWASGNLIDTTP